MINPCLCIISPNPRGARTAMAEAQVVDDSASEETLQRALTVYVNDKTSALRRKLEAAEKENGELLTKLTAMKEQLGLAQEYKKRYERIRAVCGLGPPTNDRRKRKHDTTVEVAGSVGAKGKRQTTVRKTTTASPPSKEKGILVRFTKDTSTDTLLTPYGIKDDDATHANAELVSVVPEVTFFVKKSHAKDIVHDIDEQPKYDCMVYYNTVDDNNSPGSFYPGSVVEHKSFRGGKGGGARIGFIAKMLDDNERVSLYLANAIDALEPGAVRRLHTVSGNQ